MHDCGHETYSGRCRKCKGEGYLCTCPADNGVGCTCPSCSTCGGTGSCASCVEARDHEERYWRGHFGAEIKNASEQARFEREEHGRELTDDERMEEARRLK
jgi:hypothetical protein